MIRLTGVNTLVFLDELENSTKRQWEYFQVLAEIGVPFVEVRREYFRDFKVELQETNKEAANSGLALLYSIPSSLFINKGVNPELGLYFEEAKAMGAIQVKLTMGSYETFADDMVSTVKSTLAKYPDIRLSIENDQSSEGGSPEALERFMETALQSGLKLGMTFDTGNFIYIGVNPLEAAKQLGKYINYIHIKNVVASDQGIELSLFEKGDIPIKQVLETLDKEERIIAAIEYPCGPKEEALSILKQEYRRITR